MIRVEQFWSHVDKRGPNDCWFWTGTVQSKGYGLYNQCLAHRLAYQLATGMNPGLLLVCHHCDVRLCCNPRHLFLGTAQDNSDDMKQKERQQRCAGEEASRAELTSANVVSIRNSLATHRILAKQYGVSESTIASARTGKTWKTVTEESGDRRHLTIDDVREIRRLLRRGETGRSVAAFFDVSEGTISMIRNRRTWKRV